MRLSNNPKRCCWTPVLIISPPVCTYTVIPWEPRLYLSLWYNVTYKFFFRNIRWSNRVTRYFPQLTPSNPHCKWLPQSRSCPTKCPLLPPPPPLLERCLRSGFLHVAHAWPIFCCTRNFPHSKSCQYLAALRWDVWEATMHQYGFKRYPRKALSLTMYFTKSLF